MVGDEIEEARGNDADERRDVLRRFDQCSANFWKESTQNSRELSRKLTILR